MICMIDVIYMKSIYHTNHYNINHSKRSSHVGRVRFCSKAKKRNPTKAISSGKCRVKNKALDKLT